MFVFERQGGCATVLMSGWKPFQGDCGRSRLKFCDQARFVGMNFQFQCQMPHVDNHPMQFRICVRMESHMFVDL